VLNYFYIVCRIGQRISIETNEKKKKYSNVKRERTPSLRSRLKRLRLFQSSRSSSRITRYCLRKIDLVFFFGHSLSRFPDSLNVCTHERASPKVHRTLTVPADAAADTLSAGENRFRSAHGSQNKGIDSPGGGHLILTKRLTSPRSRSLLFVLKHNSGAFGSAFARRRT
jgi:hypothetical protein